MLHWISYHSCLLLCLECEGYSAGFGWFQPVSAYKGAFPHSVKGVYLQPAQLSGLLLGQGSGQLGGPELQH